METISNEEKAIEFATSYDGKIIGFAHLAALQMGAWKDEQHAKEKESFFKEYRKEILDACIYDFEQKKQQLIDKAMKVICDGCAQKAECEFNNWKTCCTKEELIKSMEE